MANLSVLNVQVLQRATKVWAQAINFEITKAQSAISGPDLVALQSALDTYKTALSGLGFTIS